MNYYLFTTTTCPKCPEVKVFIAENIQFSGDIIDNNNPSFMDLAGKFGVSQAPTFIVLENEAEVFRGSEVYEITEFLKTL